MARSRRRRLPTEPVLATIESLSKEGRGYCLIDGRDTHIHGALPGEQVRFLYSRRSRKGDQGIFHELIQGSPDRVEPQCEHFGLCGGCSLQHLSPEAQIRTKQQTLIEAFQQIGRVKPESLLPPLAAETPWGYRRKARLGVKFVINKGRVLVGFRELGTSYVADLKRCLVLDPKVGELITPLGDLIARLSIREQVPQIEVAMGENQCVLIFRVLSPPSTQDIEALRGFAEQQRLDIYLQAGGPDTARPLNGEEADLSYDLPSYQVRIHFQPQDFTQVNNELNRLMIDQALGLLAPRRSDHILDLFCGLGNFTLPLARHAGRVDGVEGDTGLVQRAGANAAANGIENCHFHLTNLYQSLERAPWLQKTYNKALLDPPRTGALEVLIHLPEMGIERILYVSCNPETLARDAGELVNRYGYRLKQAGVMDMFPHTAHVESMALFEKS